MLNLTNQPEPLPVDMVGETPAEATVLVRSVIDACQRYGSPIAQVAIDPGLGKGLLREHPGSYQGVKLTADDRLADRIKFFRFPSI